MYFKANFMAISHMEDSTQLRYMYIIKHNSGIHSSPLDLDIFFFLDVSSLLRVSKCNFWALFLLSVYNKSIACQLVMCIVLCSVLFALRISIAVNN